MGKQQAAQILAANGAELGVRRRSTAGRARALTANTAPLRPRRSNVRQEASRLPLRELLGNDWLRGCNVITAGARVAGVATALQAAADLGDLAARGASAHLLLDVCAVEVAVTASARIPHGLAQSGFEIGAAFGGPAPTRGATGSNTVTCTPEPCASAARAQ
eukprot:3247368-Alexandrium_andersonii.AAC.1